MLSRIKQSEIIQPINKRVPVSFYLNECVDVNLLLFQPMTGHYEIIFTHFHFTNNVKDKDKSLWTTMTQKQCNK